jgi:hypothetical protein
MFAYDFTTVPMFGYLCSMNIAYACYQPQIIWKSASVNFFTFDIKFHAENTLL